MAFGVDPATGQQVGQVAGRAAGVPEGGFTSPAAVAAAIGANIATPTPAPTPNSTPRPTNPYERRAAAPDAFMTDAPRRPAPTGSRCLIYESMKIYMQEVLVTPTQKFYDALAARDEILRIKKALGKKPASRMAADTIQRVETERRVDESVINDLVNRAVNKKTAALQREVQQLKSPGNGGGNKNKNGKNKKGFRGAGKAAGRPGANNKNRAGAAGGGNATCAAKGKKKNGNTNGKRGGKQRSSSKGRRN